MMAFMASSEADQELQRQKHLEAVKKAKIEELFTRHRPDYNKFLCFLLMFMSISEEDMPFYCYWLWYELPKKVSRVSCFI